LIAVDWVLPVTAAPIRNGAVLVSNGRITAVSPAGTIPIPKGCFEMRFPGCAVLPAFINAHTHLDYSALPAAGDGLPFFEWLELLYNLSSNTTPEEAASAASNTASDLLKSGVAYIADAGPLGISGPILAERGIGGVIFLEVFGIDVRDNLQERMSRLKERISELRRTLNRSLSIGVSPHSPYTAGPELLRIANEYAAANKLPLCIHTAESVGEIERLMGLQPVFSLSRRENVQWTPPKTTPVRYLHSLGLLRPGVVCAHCVHIDKEEIDLLASSGASVVICPRSNALHGHGIPPFTDLIAAGVPVGLGTDGTCSVGRLDMLEEMRFALALERARLRSPTAVYAKTVLEAATIGSAKALDLHRETGSIEVGKSADLTVVELPSGRLNESNIEPAVVLGACSPVRMTMRSGRILWSGKCPP
jgi:cytosine/adenosine deaminase-related metal-dependent hydrolase